VSSTTKQRRRQPKLLSECFQILIMKENNPEGVSSTDLPAAARVKGESKVEISVGLDSTQKLALIKKVESQSSRELEKTLFDIDSEVCNERERNIDKN